MVDVLNRFRVNINERHIKILTRERKAKRHPYMTTAIYDAYFSQALIFCHITCRRVDLVPTKKAEPNGAKV